MATLGTLAKDGVVIRKAPCLHSFTDTSNVKKQRAGFELLWEAARSCETSYFLEIWERETAPAELVLERTVNDESRSSLSELIASIGGG
jgi:hypothetical protein